MDANLAGRLGRLGGVELGDRAGEDDAAAAGARPGAEVDDVIGRLDDLRVVFDDRQGVALGDETPQDAEQAVCVAGVEADRRLVEDVEGVGEARAEGRRQVDPLGLAARQGTGLAVERQIGEPHVVEVGEAAADFAEEDGRLGGVGLVEAQGVEPRPQVLDRQDGQVRQIPPLEEDAERLRLQPPPAARRTRIIAAVPRDHHAHVDLVPFRLEPVEEALDAGPVGRLVAVPDEPLGFRGQVDVGDVRANALSVALAAAFAVHFLVGGRLPARDRAVVDAASRVGDDF